jgi:hypothetical protein
VARLFRYENDVLAESSVVYGNSMYCEPEQSLCINASSATAYLPIVSTSTYEVENLSQIYIYFQDSGQYVDALDYQRYKDLSDAGLPILAPNGFVFSGGSEINYTSFSSIFLGFVNSFWDILASQKSKEPHHLKVESDEHVSTSCSAKRREIKYSIVDIDGRRVGRTSHREFHDAVVNLQCIPQSALPTPTACHLGITGGQYVGLNDRNPFTDLLTVGCAYASGDQCGFTINPQRWVWCSPTGQLAVFNHTNLSGPLTTDVRVPRTTINGAEKFNRGTQLGP